MPKAKGVRKTRVSLIFSFSHLARIVKAGERGSVVARACAAE